MVDIRVFVLSLNGKHLKIVSSLAKRATLKFKIIIKQ